MQTVRQKERKSDLPETTLRRGIYLAFALGDVEYGNVKDTARILLDIDKVLDTQEINKELKKIRAIDCKRMLYCE